MGDNRFMTPITDESISGSFKKPLHTLSLFRANIEDVLNTYLPIEQNPYHQKVIQAMTYSFQVGGKRIRPMLMYGAYDLFLPKGKDESDVSSKTPPVDRRTIEIFMTAMEMIHTYSLIHDDLPAMDNDDLRRGKPTCHIEYGEANAILAGDGLLNYAFELVLSCGMTTNNSHAALMKAMYLLARSSGIYGMIGGQAADMYFETTELKERFELDYIHRHKTGAIITSALCIGGVLGGADEVMLQLLEEIGQHIGLSFQIQDDILDCTSTAEVLGKPIGSDEKNNKKTYVTFVGIEQSKKDVIYLLQQAKEKTVKLQSMIGLSHEQSLLLELIDFLSERKY